MDDSRAVTARAAGPDAGIDVRRVRAAAGGDLVAFRDLAAARLPVAYRLASVIMSDQTAAAEATQDALLAAWRELPRLRDVEQFDPWFLRIVVGACRMRLRGRAEGAGTADAESAVRRLARASLDATLERERVLDLLDDAFERLDGDDRAMLALHDLEALPVAEIAEAVHMPAGTVKWRLHEARQALRHALDAVG